MLWKRSWTGHERSNFRNCLALARGPKFRFAQFSCVGRDDRLVTNVNLHSSYHTIAELIKRQWYHQLTWYNSRPVNPTCLQILRINGEWVIDDVIMQGTWHHILEKNVGKRCCFNCNIWPNWFTSHQSHYCLYYNGIPEFVRKRSMLTGK